MSSMRMTLTDIFHTKILLRLWATMSTWLADRSKHEIFSHLRGGKKIKNCSIVLLDLLRKTLMVISTWAGGGRYKVRFFRSICTPSSKNTRDKHTNKSKQARWEVSLLRLTQVAAPLCGDKKNCTVEAIEVVWEELHLLLHVMVA